MFLPAEFNTAQRYFGPLEERRFNSVIAHLNTSRPERFMISRSGERGRLARSFRRLAENIRTAKRRTIWCGWRRTRNSR